MSIPDCDRGADLFGETVPVTGLAIGASLSLDRAGATDLPLQKEHSIKQRLGRWRAAGNVDIDRDHPVTAAQRRLGVVVIAAAIGA